MSFRPNPSVQISFDDSFGRLTQRSQSFMHGSWAESFSTEVFPNIDEESFSVLYSDNKATCPNAPVNVIVGALILKEMRGLTDQAVVESMVFDVRYQYALHTTSCEEQPLSERTLRRFRKRLLHYEEETGVDLVKQCVLGLSDQIAKVMSISGSVRRMDSMMIAANIKNMSRAELGWTCVRNLVRLAS